MSTGTQSRGWVSDLSQNGYDLSLSSLSSHLSSHHISSLSSLSSHISSLISSLSSLSPLPSLFRQSHPSSRPFRVRDSGAVRDLTSFGDGATFRVCHLSPIPTGVTTRQKLLLRCALRTRVWAGSVAVGSARLCPQSCTGSHPGRSVSTA